MVKYIGVWDFHDTPVSDDTLNELFKETKYSMIWGDKDHNVKNMLLDEEKPLSALIVESRVAFYSKEAKDSLQNFLIDIKSKNKFPVIIFTDDDRSTVQMDYGLEKGVHYDRFVSKLNTSCLKELRNTLNEILD